jgi:hypothetical protein
VPRDSLDVLNRSNASELDSVPWDVWFFRPGLSGLVKFRKNISQIAERYRGGVLHCPALPVSRKIMT